MFREFGSSVPDATAFFASLMRSFLSSQIPSLASEEEAKERRAHLLAGKFYQIMQLPLIDCVRSQYIPT